MKKILLACICMSSTFIFSMEDKNEASVQAQTKPSLMFELSDKQTITVPYEIYHRCDRLYGSSTLTISSSDWRFVFPYLKKMSQRELEHSLENLSNDAVQNVFILSDYLKCNTLRCASIVSMVDRLVKTSMDYFSLHGKTIENFSLLSSEQEQEIASLIVKRKWLTLPDHYDRKIHALKPEQKLVNPLTIHQALLCLYARERRSQLIELSEPIKLSESLMKIYAQAPKEVQESIDKYQNVYF